MDSGQSVGTIDFDFSNAFQSLTGHPHFPWQRRLFDEYLSCGRLPQSIDIPTGLGKTTVMVLWLLARASGAALPRRLIYVVDRRAVVDQATEFAEQLRSALEKNKDLELMRQKLGLHDSPLAISTLRGRYVDNREWMADPAAPAIIVGTVDMIGSRLLFEGYGVSQRMRPYAAGLMGCDSLVILDEAHLVRPFEHLLRSIENGQRPVTTNEPQVSTGSIFAGSKACQKLPPPFHMLPLSATREENGNDTALRSFRITDADKKDKTVCMRLDANKALSIKDLHDKCPLEQMLSEEAWQLTYGGVSTSATKPVRILIYCDLRSDAENTAKFLRKRIKKEKYKAPVLLFVGGRRVHEREQTAEEMKHYGFIGNRHERDMSDSPVFVVATSAGEVGVDLDAHHMICDLVPWERMVQRLGRVNRRGISQARVLVIDQGKSKKEDKDKHNRLKATRKLLESLTKDSNGFHQAGPAALLALRDKPIYSECISEASTSSPLHPTLTRPLIDSWSMTSLNENAGRPEVGPWLRGWVKDQAQTIVVWRRYLPVLISNNQCSCNSKDVVAAFFEAAPPQTEELLESETSRIVQWLKKRAKSILYLLKQESGILNYEANHEIAPLQEGAPIVFLLDRRSRPASKSTLSLLQIKNAERKSLEQQLANQQIVVDSRLGGIENGLLSDNFNDAACTIEDNWGKSESEGLSEYGPPIRVKTLRETERARKLGRSQIPQESADKTVLTWREALSIPYCTSLERDSTEVWLVVEQRRGREDSEEVKAIMPKAQRLDEHQAWTAEQASRLADKVGLNKDYRTMLIEAARHHDDGKKAVRWQRAFNASMEGGPYAKTAGPFNHHVLNGYRHELKSALDTETNGLDSIDRSDPRFELCLHLIASHHGHARPAIPIDSYDDLPPSKAASHAHNIALRFARLQQEWGPWGLAWWEALLRAADQRASKMLDQHEHAKLISETDSQRQIFTKTDLEAAH